MNCKQVERDEVIEQYVAGTLPEAARAQWEEHYFGCEECFRKLESFRVVADALRRSQDEIRAEPLRRPVSVWIPLLAAAAVLLAVGVAWFSQRRNSAEVAVAQPPATRPQPDRLLALAAIEPPAYQPSTFRAAAPADGAFDAAMVAYRTGDYEKAIAGLRRTSEAQPKRTDVRFFLGVSCLLANQTANGITELQAVTAAGDTPFQDEAWFYLAKAHLRLRDVTEARADLQHVIASNRDLVPKARVLLDQLEDVR